MTKIALRKNAFRKLRTNEPGKASEQVIYTGPLEMVVKTTDFVASGHSGICYINSGATAPVIVTLPDSPKGTIIHLVLDEVYGQYYQVFVADGLTGWASPGGIPLEINSIDSPVFVTSGTASFLKTNDSTWQLFSYSGVVTD